MKKNNIIIQWIALFTDVLLYIVLLFTIVNLFPDAVPISIVYHPWIAAFVGIIIFLMFSMFFPTIIHKRKVEVADLITRNFIVVLTSQLIFFILWHMITINSGHEKMFNGMMSVGLFCGLLFKRHIERKILAWYRKSGGNTKSILFIGSDPANLMLYEDIMSDPATGYKIVGYYSNDIIEGAPPALKKIGSKDEFERLITEGSPKLQHVDDIYCSISHDESEFLEKIIRYCDNNVIRFFYVPRIFKNIQMSLHPEVLGYNTVVFSNHSAAIHEPFNRFIKRVFDIVVSFIVLLVLVPVVPIIAIIIKVQSPGPVFFKQFRTGMNGKDFYCYKFRSMHVNVDADKIQATKDDPRKFAFGDFMRKFNVDELPQFFNVLIGNMSIVGPRPHMKLHTEMYSALIDKYMVRHFAKPGITGLAQVTGFRGETNELWQMEGRIKKDIWYIEHWTFMLDLRICFLTAKTMVVHDENAY